MKRSISFLLAHAVLLVSAVASARGPATLDLRTTTPALAIDGASTRGLAAQLGGQVTSLDTRTGRPTMLTSPSGARGVVARESLRSLDPAAAAREHLHHFAAAYRVEGAAIDAARVTRLQATRQGDARVTFRSFHLGLEVFEQDTKVLLDRRHDLRSISGSPHPGARAGVTPPDVFLLAPEEALESAITDLLGETGLTLPVEVVSTGEVDGGGFERFALSSAPSSASDVALSMPGRVKRVYFPLGDELVAAFEIEVCAGAYASSTSACARYVLDAGDGRILHRRDLSSDATFRAWVDADGRPTDGPTADFTPHPTGVADGSIPSFVDATLVTQNGFNSPGGGPADPWLPLPGAPAIDVTRGNNVDAYTDHQAPDGFTAGDLRGAVTSPDTFDHTFDVTAEPLSSTAQMSAATVGLFYVTNWLHDYFYDSGFDEVAGNAQVSNYGRGGVEGDPLHAEAQDSAIEQSDFEGGPPRFNNANMVTLADGASPRMQIYLYSPAVTATATASPTISTYGAKSALFSPGDFDVTASVVEVDDATGTPSDGCEVPWNDVTGAIAVVDRGTCTFGQKAANAVASGAVGLIVINNVPGGGAFAMPDTTGATVAIPALMLNFEHGADLRADLSTGATTTLHLAGELGPYRDAAFDHLTVAHEWGHYLHQRLTTGSNWAAFALSEGWADFIALHLAIRQGDDLDGAFAYGGYANAAFGDSFFFGSRRFPYSRDFNKNGLSFRHITDGEPLPTTPKNPSIGFENSESHNAGEVWASMLLEAYGALIDRSAGASPPYDFDAARRRMADYVVAGMQITPTDATWTEARDGLLGAAWNADPDDARALAEGFARRGAGTCAIAPDRSSDSFDGVVEDFTLSPAPGLGALTTADDTEPCAPDGNLDAGESGTLTLEIQNTGFLALEDATVTLTAVTPGVTLSGGSTFEVPSVPPRGAQTIGVAIALGDELAAADGVEVEVAIASTSSCAVPPAATRTIAINLGTPGDCPGTTTSSGGGQGGTGDAGAGGTGAGAPGNGGAGDTAQVGATSTSSADASGTGGSSALEDDEASGDGCGCRMAGDERRSTWAVAALGLGALALGRRRPTRRT